MRKFKIKESHLPLDLLYNKELNEIKEQEFVLGQIPKAITFSMITNPNVQDTQNFVRFEIEGSEQVIETKFIRKNEE